MRGVALHHATLHDRDRTHSEFGESPRYRLMTFGLEVGGRWGEDAAKFFRRLTYVPAVIQRHPARLR